LAQDLAPTSPVWERLVNRALDRTHRHRWCTPWNAFTLNYYLQRGRGGGLSGMWTRLVNSAMMEVRPELGLMPLALANIAENNRFVVMDAAVSSMNRENVWKVSYFLFA
jgi:hypothetical protein